MEHLTEAACLMRPSFEISEIMTTRFERDRPQTERWLAQHGISYRSLTMAPFASATERAKNGGFAERKATIYQERWDAILFVESCPTQAETIARLTGKPVLSWPQNEILNGVSL